MNKNAVCVNYIALPNFISFNKSNYAHCALSIQEPYMHGEPYVLGEIYMYWVEKPIKNQFDWTGYQLTCDLIWSLVNINLVSESWERMQGI